MLALVTEEGLFDEGFKNGCGGRGPIARPVCRTSSMCKTQPLCVQGSVFFDARSKGIEALSADWHVTEMRGQMSRRQQHYDRSSASSAMPLSARRLGDKDAAM